MTLFERLKSTDNKVKRCIAFLLFLMILLTSTIIPVKRAKAIAPVLVGVGIVALVTAGLVACGIAVNADDDGTDASTALGYTMQYVRQKMREAKVTELEAGLMVATGAINLAGQAWQWIKQAAANIYNNASYFQGSANAFQIGNLINNCLRVSLTNFYIPGNRYGGVHSVLSSPPSNSAFYSFDGSVSAISCLRYSDSTFSNPYFLSLSPFEVHHYTSAGKLDSTSLIGDVVVNGVTVYYFSLDTMFNSSYLTNSSSLSFGDGDVVLDYGSIAIP